MTDYSSVDFSINPMGDSVTMVTSDGTTFQVELSIVHAKSEQALYSMPKRISDTIAPGSIAYVTGMQNIWQKDFNGEWVGVDL